MRKHTANIIELLIIITMVISIVLTVYSAPDPLVKVVTGKMSIAELLRFLTPAAGVK